MYHLEMLNDLDVNWLKFNVNSLDEYITNKIMIAAKKCKMYTDGRINIIKPWLNNYCKNLRKSIRLKLKICRNNNFKQDLVNEYIECKKKYKIESNLSLKKYKNEIINNLIKTKNSKEFWKQINKTRKNSLNTQNCISSETWYNYYKDFFSINGNEVSSQIHRKLVKSLDSEIHLEEIRKSLVNSKNGKAAGLNGISNEFLKNIPEHWILLLNVLFNKILDKECTPESWSRVVVTMLYKNKGDKKDPMNYRPIGLINCIYSLY